MSTILVTGGAGYIGSHTCKALAKAGYVPIAYDNLSRGNRNAVQWGPLVEGDISASTALLEAIQTHSPVAVIHFAAYAYVGESLKAPEKYYINNVAGTLNLLEMMRKASLLHIVFSSTCAVYGTPNQIPISEKCDTRPINPYGETKLMVERMLHWFGQAHNFSTMVLRYFNAAGADMDGAIGELHQPETHLIPLAIGAALGIYPTLKIFGTNYKTPDGTAVRDYIHVDDLATAHVKAVEYLMEGGKSEILNIGNSQGHSVRQIIQSVERVSGRAVPTALAPRRLGDPPKLVADGRIAKKILGWSPVHTNIDNIVKSAFDWHASGENFSPSLK